MAGERPQGGGWCCWWRRAKKPQDSSSVTPAATRVSPSPSSGSPDKEVSQLALTSPSTPQAPQRVPPLPLEMAASEGSSTPSPRRSSQSTRLGSVRLSETQYNGEEYLDQVDSGVLGTQWLTEEELADIEKDAGKPYVSPFK